LQLGGAGSPSAFEQEVVTATRTRTAPWSSAPAANRHRGRPLPVPPTTTCWRSANVGNTDIRQHQHDLSCLVGGCFGARYVDLQSTYTSPLYASLTGRRCRRRRRLRVRGSREDEVSVVHARARHAARACHR
jgi:hypothetical protein